VRVPDKEGRPGAGGADAQGKLAALLALVALGTSVAILATYNVQYPIADWFLVQGASYWALTLYWGAGCLAFGVQLLALIAPRHYRVAERVFIGFALGVLAFGLAVFGVGLFGGLNLYFFVLTPGLFLLAGAPELRRLIAQRRALFPPLTWRPSRLELCALAFGAVGMVAVYLPILTPHNVQNDARWYHLTLAQQYASSGRIEAFREGWFLAAYPHLASLLYSWALLQPRGIVHRLELCAHMELLVFAMTIAATPVLLRRLLPGTRLPLAWVGFFLFPGFLVYDSNPSVGADHVAAVFAPAGLLALFAALRTANLRHCALVGVLAAGAALTKYSALCIALPLLGFTALGVLSQLRKRPRRALLGPLAMLAAFAVVFAPHWLKNLLWYGDPFYPILHAYFPAHPWGPDGAKYFQLFVEKEVLRPKHNLAGVLESLGVAATLGFTVNEYAFHAKIPTFGFLFAATLYCAPFVGASRRMWITYGLGLCAALVWYWTNHRDRYLQACLPWLVAVTLATLVLAWRKRGRLGQLAVGMLVSAQLMCGAGAAFIPSHTLIPGFHPMPFAMQMIGMGYLKNHRPRFEPYDEWGFSAWTAIGQLLPRGSKVLVHEDRLWVGLDAPVVVDEASWEAGIRYGDFKTAAQLYDLYRGLGVTHLITGQSYEDSGEHGVAGHLVFWDFLSSHCRMIGTRGKLTLWQMPPRPPTPIAHGPAVAVTCSYGLPGGRYVFSEIAAHKPLPALPAPREIGPSALQGAELVAFEFGCGYTATGDAFANFQLMTQRGRLALWRRR
jgi:hypothetical protein